MNGDTDRKREETSLVLNREESKIRSVPKGIYDSGGHRTPYDVVVDEDSATIKVGEMTEESISCTSVDRIYLCFSRVLFGKKSGRLRKIEEGRGKKCCRD